MKRTIALMLMAALAVMLTAAPQTACADEDGMEIAAELTLTQPAAGTLTEDTDVPSEGEGAGDEDIPVEDEGSEGGNE